MRAIDAWAIADRGVPSLELMERAGAGLAPRGRRDRAATARSWSSPARATTAGTVSSPRGCCASSGREVEVLLAGEPDEVSGDARINLERLPGAAAQPLALDDRADRRRSSIDALLGTGATGEPRGAIARGDRARPVRAARACSRPTSRAASTRRAARSPASRSMREVTVTFHAAKPGLWIEPGRGHAGSRPRDRHRDPAGRAGRPAAGADPRPGARARSRDAARLDEVHERPRARRRRLARPDRCAVPRRARGRARRRRLRDGVRAGVAGARLRVAAARADDARAARRRRRATPARARRSWPRRRASAAARSCSARASAAARTPRRSSAASLERVDLPIVLDADGLHPFAGRVRRAVAGRAAVLTPHEGELGRLLGVPSAAMSRRRVCDHAREAAARAAAPSSCSRATTRSSRSPTVRSRSARARRPALATAGTGDVLAGVIGAMLAKGLDPFARGERRRATARARGGPRGRRSRRRGHDRLRRDRGAPGGARVSGRAVARVNLAAIERNCARLAASSPRAVRGRQGQRLRARRRRVRARRARRRGVVARRGRGRRGGRAARRRRRRADPRDGRADPRRARARRSPPTRTSSPGPRISSTGCASLGSGRVHVKLDSGMGRLGTRDGALADRLADASSPQRRELELAGADDASGDRRGGRPGVPATRSSTASRAGSRRCASAIPQLLVHAENSAALLGAGARALRHGALRRRRSTGSTPSASVPAPGGSRRRSSCARGSRRSSRARPARAPATGARFIAREATELAVIPVGYGDGVRRRPLRTTPTC